MPTNPQYQMRTNVIQNNKKMRSKNENIPLKNNYLINIDNISKEIFYGLKGDSFWFVMLFNGNIYILLLIITIIICNMNIIYIQWIIIIMKYNDNVFEELWEYGLIYIPMQIILFLFYPLIILWFNNNDNNKICVLIIGLILLSLTMSSMTIIYDNIYLLFVMFLFLSSSTSFIFATFTKIFNERMVGNKYKKPLLLIISIASRFGYIVGSLIGGKLSDYFGINTTLLILSAFTILYLPVLIALLRETNHNNMLLIQNDDSSEDDENDHGLDNNTRNKRVFVASKFQMVDSD